MTLEYGWTRRMVLAAKASLGAAIVAPSAAWAKLRETTGDAGTSAVAPTPVAPARWHTATAEELGPYLGQRFRIKTRAHGTMAVRLTEVHSPVDDPDRPAHLVRRKSVMAIFEGPDAALLNVHEDEVHTVSHPRIGAVQAFLKTTRRPDGGHEIEMVLN